jgi:hypothetical protein
MKPITLKNLPSNKELMQKVWRVIAPCQKPFKNKKQYNRKNKEITE